MKKMLFPVLGIIVLVGILVQIGLGYSIASGASKLKEAHTYIGYVGLVLGIALTAAAWKSATAKTISKGLISIFLIALLIQVWMGQGLLGGSLTYVRYHEVLGILMLILAIGEAVVTSVAARRRHKAV